MATKKSSGVSKNGRDSKSKRLGLKIYNNEFVFPGCIIIRQNGCKFFPGKNTKLGKDYTIYSLIFGYVKFIEKSKILYVCVLKNYQFIFKKKLFDL